METAWAKDPLTASGRVSAKKASQTLQVAEQWFLITTITYGMVRR